MEQVDFLEQEAVDSAIKADWKKAIEFNKQILQIDKHSIAASLRLGFCYLQTNDIVMAKKSYLKALKMQPGNSVASENIERIEILELKHSKKTPVSSQHIDPNLFLEIPGKTKAVGLVNVGQKNILAHLTIGHEVVLSAKRRKVEVRTKSQDYIGTIPDDLSRRMLLFLKAKSEYKAYIKEAGVNKTIIFIKEEKKGKTVAHYFSFPSNIQAQIQSITQEQDGEAADSAEEEGVEGLGHDLEKMAENLGSEEKEYLPYEAEEREGADEE